MKIIRIGEAGMEAAATETAAALARGRIVLFPSDTLYGLAVDASDSAAVARLAALKGRDAQKAISIIVPSAAAIPDYAEVSETAQRLIKAYLPGPLTLVLPLKGTELAHMATDGTIGIRIPNDPFTLALSRILSTPYTATSANVSGQQTRVTVQEICEQFGDKAAEIDLVIDDGPRASSEPSTVVKIVGNEIEILREGAIPSADIAST